MKVNHLKLGPDDKLRGFVLISQHEPGKEFQSSVAVRPDGDATTNDLFSITVHRGENGIPACQVFVTDDPARTPARIEFGPPDELAVGGGWRRPVEERTQSMYLGTYAAARCGDMHNRLRAVLKMDPDTAADEYARFLHFLRDRMNLPAEMRACLNEFLRDLA